jgi:hypothetical protein
MSQGLCGCSGRLPMLEPQLKAIYIHGQLSLTEQQYHLEIVSADPQVQCSQTPMTAVLLLDLK